MVFIKNQHIGLREELTLSNVEGVIQQIRGRIDDTLNSALPLSFYLLPSDLVKPDEELYEKLVTETRDVLDRTGIHDVKIPMAKIIPYVNGLVFKLVQRNNFTQELLLLEELKKLAGNIYEAFGNVHSGNN